MEKNGRVFEKSYGTNAARTLCGKKNADFSNVTASGTYIYH
jgi:hypothetical protein